MTLPFNVTFTHTLVHTLSPFPDSNNTFMAGSLMMTSTGIIIPPVIVGWKVGHFVTVGSTIELSCEATGYPAPMVIWIREGREVRGDLVERENGTLATLIIANASSEDAGIYECITWNFGGTVMRYALVFVKGMRSITELIS